MSIHQRTPSIEMHDVTVASTHRADVAEIENINWRAHAGDFWIVGGMHGSGKSAFISTAAGLQRPMQGTVLLSGVDFSSLHEHELLEHRKRIGVVFENGGRLFRRLTLLENILLPLCYHHDWSAAKAEPEALKLLETVGLARLARETVSALNPSFQQRAALARALTLKPEILFLDKPMVASRDRRWWPEFLKKLGDGSPLTDGKPVTIVVATDDLQPWTEVGKHFALLKGKRWQSLGEQAEVREKLEPILHEFWSEDLNE